MNTHELAWAAGFFDGEGCTARKGNSAVIRMAQVDRHVLDRFQEAVQGLGGVWGPNVKHTQPTAQPYFSYQTHGFEKTQAVIAMLWKWLSPAKRAQAKMRLEQARPYGMGWNARGRRN